MDYLPRFLNDLALQQGYQPRDKVFANRKKLRNPLVMLMSSGLGRLSDDLKQQIREESYYGQCYGFEKDYVQDINACQMVGCSKSTNELTKLFFTFLDI